MAQGPGRQSASRRHITQPKQVISSYRRSQSAESRSDKYSAHLSEHAHLSASGNQSDSGRTDSEEQEFNSRYGASFKNSYSGVPEMGIKTIEMENSSVIQTVEIFKRPGQSLGFYIREGNGLDRQEGVFISRIQAGTVAESNGLLHVGDEILSVNEVEVGKMSLDDVVILMSIPRKLIIKVRSMKTCNKKNASCPSLAVTENDGPPQVAVLKKGHVRASSDTQLEMTEKIPNMFEYSSQQDSTDPLVRRPQRQERNAPQYASIYISPQKAEAKLITGDENNDSENSSEGSFPRSIDSGSRDFYSGHRGYSASIGPIEDPYSCLAPATLPSFSFPQNDSSEREYAKIIHSDRRFSPGTQRSPSKSSTFSQHTGQSRYCSSEDDRGAYSDTYQPPSDIVNIRGDPNKRYQCGFRELMHSKVKYGERIQRTRSPECYNSDSEILYTHPGGQAASDTRGFASDYETYAGAFSDDEPVYVMPKQPISSSGSTELQILLRKFNSLSHELQHEQIRLQQQLSLRDKPGNTESNVMLYKTASVFSF